MGQTKSKFIEVDLIFIPQEAEKWENDVKTLLRKIDTCLHIVKGRQVPVGEKIRNKWIVICESDIDPTCLPETQLPGMMIICDKTGMKGPKEYVSQNFYPDKRIHYITKATFPDDTLRARRAVKALIEGDFLNADTNSLILDEGFEKKSMSMEFSSRPQETSIKDVDSLAISSDFLNADTNSLNLDEGFEKKSMSMEFSRPQETSIKDVDSLAISSDTHDKDEGFEKKNMSMEVSSRPQETNIKDVDSLAISTVKEYGKTQDTNSTEIKMIMCSSDIVDIVEESLLSFLDSCFNKDVSEINSNFTSGSLHPHLMENASSSAKLSPFSQREYGLEIGGVSLRFVVYDVKASSKFITVKENEELDEQIHIAIDKDGINENCVVNVLALKDIEKFIQELSADDIDIIPQIQHEGNVFLLSLLESKFKYIQFQLRKPKSIPERPYIVICHAENGGMSVENTKSNKGHNALFLTVHDSPEEAKITEVKEKHIQRIHIVFGNSMIDERIYLNQRAKREIHNILMTYKTGLVAEYEEEETMYGKVKELPNTDVSSLSQQKRQVYIKCISGLPKKAFSDFLEKYIRRIEPIWKTGEETIKKGSLCIAVCFTLSRLLDDISAVINITPLGCTNMLVVIQNCRQGISHGALLKHNPNSCYADFTNILYGDGECYDCDVNSDAKRKIQSFIDSN